MTLAHHVEGLRARVHQHPFLDIEGRLTGAAAGRIRTRLPGLAIGELCALSSPSPGAAPLAQVVALDESGAVLTPLGTTEGLSPATKVRPLWRPLDIAVGEGLLGQVLDGLGRPLSGELSGLSARRPTAPGRMDPMRRPPITDRADTGLRVIDAMASLGVGQRVGVFGPAGSGKTSLMGQLARNIRCDVVVLGLIGERGREIREFLERQLPPEARARCVVVAATSDAPAMERVCGAHAAATIAEYFRDTGRHVLLILDSLTRFARALREVGLAAGETAVRRGFTPSVYTELPRVIERAGVTERGAITALYTVLAESESEEDPIVEEVKSLTDGHIHLSPALARVGHYPAIDILKTTSRLMGEIMPEEDKNLAYRARELLAKYEEISLLVQVGEYKRGFDLMGDAALDAKGPITAFLRQGARERSSREQTRAALAAAVKIEPAA